MSNRTESIELVDCDICGVVVEQDGRTLKPHYKSYEDVYINNDLEIAIGFDCCKSCLVDLFHNFKG